MKKKINRRGFTIVELVIVIAVIAILATVLVPAFGDIIQKAQDSKAMQEAKNAYTDYIVEHNGVAAEYMVYEADGRFVAIHNGAAVGVYDSKEDALAAMVANGDPALLADAGDGLWVYGGNDKNSENPYKGKSISILGDSISTYLNVSNNAAYNSTIGKNAVYYNQYNASRHPVHMSLELSDTWWMQTIDALDMKLCVNNAWSGGAILTRENITPAYERCVQLHNDKTGEKPDVIVVYIGTNDYGYHKNKIGNAEFNDADLIHPNGDGTYTYTTPQTACQGYAIMLHKISVAYPDAEVFCMNLLPRRAEDLPNDGHTDPGGQPTEFNANLAKIVERFGYTMVDLEQCGITPEIANFDTYIPDQRVHPGKLGMDMITNALVDTMLGKDTSVCNISANYEGVIGDQLKGSVLKGESYRVKLSVQTGYENLSVTVKMEGKDITAQCYQNGEIYIAAVNGDVTIEALAVKMPASYRWEFDGNSATNITANRNSANELTKLGGTISGGVLNGAYFSLENEVVLHHNLPWIVEWSAAGDWSGMILSQEMASAVEGNRYIFKSNYSSIKLTALGYASGGVYENYGIALGEKINNITDRHIYRLENRIAEDGTNTVYLWIDNVEIGAMNNHYDGVTNQNSTSNWSSGKDFTFAYIGTSGHPLNSCDLDYLQIYEGGIN